MKDAGPLKLGSVAAFYLLWLGNWLVLKEVAFGPQNYSWTQALVATAAGLIAFRASRRVAKPYPAFLVMLGVGLLLLAVSWATYDPGFRRPFLHFGGEDAPSYSDVSQAGFVFALICAWGYLAIVEWRRKPPSALTSIVFAVLMFGLAIILANFYFPEYGSSLDTIAGRLDAVIAGLEFLLLAIGLACVLLGQPAIITWMLFATAVLIAGEIVYSSAEVPDSIQPIWMFAELLLLGTLLMLPDTLTPAAGVPMPPTSVSEPGRSRRSGLSGLLILLSLGAVLLSVAVWLALVPSVWKHFFSILFVVGLVVILVWITDRFDEAVQYLKAYATKLHRQRLEGDDWRQADPQIRALLHSTGLGAYLDTLCDSADRLKQDVLFLGPERLYPPPKPSGQQGGVRCFLVMPFSFEWSNDVHRILAGACKAAGVHPVRGDDLFTPTDILDDIWQALNGADFVIADITGRNPNVLYELGIAHALAKPVLILSRNAQDIPIDLSTRRVILYGQAECDWREELAHKVAKAIADLLGTYALQPRAARFEERTDRAENALDGEETAAFENREGFGASSSM
jgi:hypothetical protein